VTLRARGDDGVEKATDFRMAIGDATNPGRAASTELEGVAWGQWLGRPVTKVVLRPSSGRRHQLRLHCVHLGFPIVGDATYTDDDKSFRMMLHAWRLVLPLPAGTMTWETTDPFVGFLDNEQLSPPSETDSPKL